MLGGAEGSKIPHTQSVCKTWSASEGGVELELAGGASFVWGLRLGKEGGSRYEAGACGQSRSRTDSELDEVAVYLWRPRS